MNYHGRRHLLLDISVINFGSWGCTENVIAIGYIEGTVQSVRRFYPPSTSAAMRKGIHMRKRVACFILAGLAGIFVSLVVFGQNPNQPLKHRYPKPEEPTPEATPSLTSKEDTIKTDTNLVTVPVVASDTSGIYVPDLRQDEFTVDEDGTKQTIAVFASVT